MTVEYPQLRADVKGAPSISGRSKPYNLYSIGESGYFLEPDLIDEVITGLTLIIDNVIKKQIHFCAISPGGNQWALSISHKLRIPLTIFRPHLSLNETSVAWSKTPFKDGYVHAPNLNSGDRIVVLDDVIGSGSISDKILKWSRDKRIDLQSFVTIVDKCTGGSQRLAENGVECLSLYKTNHLVIP